MEVTVWVAVAVAVLTSAGPQYAIREQAFESKALCEAFQVASAPLMIEAMGPDLIAQGFGCVEVTVKAVDAKPEPKAKPGVKKFTPEQQRGDKDYL